MNSMSLSSLEFMSELPSSRAADVLVVGARSSAEGPVLVAAEGISAFDGALSELGVSGRADSFVKLPSSHPAAPVLAIVGLGDEVTPETVRNAAGAAVRQLAGTTSVLIAFSLEDADHAVAAAEGAALGAYTYTAEKGVSAKTSPVQDVSVLGASPDEAEVERIRVTADAVHLVRDLGNTSASELFPQSFVERAKSEADGLPVDVTVWGDDELEKDGFGGILGVGRGSVRGPRLVKLEYSPEGAEKHVAVVGKGITFDTGGLSLKPATGMLGMKYDMLGAASALATVIAAARLGTKTRVTSWLCLAENMPSGSATRPGDVLRMYGGRTVEVTNTDAEGRLVMADGLVAASEENPDLIVDVATLTGAAVVALGTRYTGVMGNDASADEVVRLADRIGEKMWRMPLSPELRSVLDSDVADIMNSNMARREGGMLVAGHFLSEFIGSRPDVETKISWVHLDIAGPGDSGSSPYGYNAKGATGVTVRTLLALAEDMATA